MQILSGFVIQKKVTMQKLDQDYKERLQAVAQIIQSSDELASYLEEEGADQYKLLQDAYEPLISEIYEEVTENNPLQIIELEKVLIHPYFEGLFIPRILGYSVLRAELNDEIKSVRPLDHFKEILIAIANSANFDVIKQRIGQTVQLGFALSSDIWITNLLDKIENKKVKAFLSSMKLDRLRDIKERQNLLQRYSKQFSHYNFFTAQFPQSVNELKIEFATIRNFLLQRIQFKSKHDSYINELHELVSKREFQKEPEHLELLAIIANFIQLSEKENSHLEKAFQDVRNNNPAFTQNYFQFLKTAYKADIEFGPQADRKIFTLLDKTKNDDLLKYYQLMETIHTKGFVHDDVLDAVNAFYSQYEGMSINNECLRLALLQQFRRVMTNLTEPEYHSYFELSRTFASYMNIFSNSAFNQEVESMSMDYIRKLLAFYKDKRSKEYQDIRKFVTANFTEFDFLTEKEVVDLFKIKRKKKADTHNA